MSATDKRSGSSGKCYPNLYYRAITLSAPGSDETNVQIPVTITYSANMDSDFNDIRFYDSDGLTSLYYYRDSYTSSTTALFIVNVPSVPSAGKTIYIYYGQSGAVTTSSGANTFVFFDDFSGISNGNPPDVSKWVVSDSDYVNVYDGDLRMSTAYGNLTQTCRALTGAGVGYGFVTYARIQPTAPIEHLGTYGTGNRVDSYGKSGSDGRWYYDLSSYADATDCGTANYFKSEIRRVTATDRQYYFNDALDHSQTGASRTDDWYLYYVMATSVPASYIYVDHCYKYKLSNSTPTVGDEQGGELYITRWRATFNGDIKDVTDSTSSGWEEKIPSGFLRIDGIFEAFLIDGENTLTEGSAINLKLNMDSDSYWSCTAYITKKPIVLEILDGDAAKVSYSFEGSGTYTETN